MTATAQMVPRSARPGCRARTRLSATFATCGLASATVRAGSFPPGQTLEAYCERLYVSYGSCEEVAARLAADAVLPYTTDLILQFSPATPPLAVAISMLEQIAEVAPALGWRVANPV